MGKRISLATAFTPSTGVVDASGIAGFDTRRVLTIINATRAAVIFDVLTPGNGFRSVSGALMTLEYDVSGQNSADVVLIFWDDGSPSQSVAPLGSIGADFSVNTPSLPNVGANFPNSGFYPNYVLLRTIVANANRLNIEIQNLSGDQALLVIDDGTAANGAPPVNASLFALAGGNSGVGSQGGGYSSQVERGRVQIYAPSSGAFLTARQN